MNTRVVSMRWIAVALLAGLAVWLAGGGVQVRALDAVGTAPALAPLAAHCDIDLFDEGSDPFSVADEVAEACPDVTAELRSVEFAGDTAWVQVVVDGGTELQVFQNRDGVWERIPYTSGPSPEWEYLIGLEEELLGGDAAGPALTEMGDGADPAAQLGPTAADIAADVRGQTYWEFLFEQGYLGAGPSGFEPRPEPESRIITLPSDAWAPQGEAYEASLAAFIGELDRLSDGAATLESSVTPLPSLDGTWAPQGDAYETGLAGFLGN